MPGWQRLRWRRWGGGPAHVHGWVHHTPAPPSHPSFNPPQVRTGCWGTFPVEVAQVEKVQYYYGAFPGGNKTVDVPVVDPMSLLGDESTDVVVLMKVRHPCRGRLLRARQPTLSAPPHPFDHTCADPLTDRH